MSFEISLEACGKLVEARLSGWLDPGGPRAAPALLVEAMRYAVFSGGKRFRPYLVIETAGMLGGDRDRAADVAAALECVHCYSLVHDDLPAMDDDDVRRGRPTTHRRYGEAAAILAGDGLLTLAFEILAAPASVADPAARAELVLGLARAAGLHGMVGGQMLDLSAEGRFAPDGREIAARQRRPAPTTAEDVRRLQAMKTGALIAFAVDAGAVLGQASAPQRQALAAFAAPLGAAFQLSDDLLDAEGEAATVGKATAKDGARGKGTLVGLLGAEAARRELQRLVEQAVQALAPFGASAERLAEAARFMGRRRS